MTLPKEHSGLLLDVQYYESVEMVWKRCSLFVRSGEQIFSKPLGLLSPALPPRYKNYIKLGTGQNAVRETL